MPSRRWPILGRNTKRRRHAHHSRRTNRPRHDIARRHCQILAGRTQGQRNQTLRHMPMRFRPPRSHRAGRHRSLVQRGHPNASPGRRKQFTLPTLQQQPQLSVTHQQSVHHEAGQIQWFGHFRNEKQLLWFADRRTERTRQTLFTAQEGRPNRKSDSRPSSAVRTHHHHHQ